MFHHSLSEKILNKKKKIAAQIRFLETKTIQDSNFKQLTTKLTAAEQNGTRFLKKCGLFSTSINNNYMQT